MLKRDYRDMSAGGLLIVGGLILALYSAANYELGTARQMGPGMFPTGLGYVIAFFGVLLFVQAMFRTGTMPEIRIWSPIFVLAGTAAFALMIRPFGMVPAIVATTLISSLAEKRIRPVSLVLLSAFLCVLSYLIFSLALRMPMPMLRWPF
jgi:hypothetical protein